MDNNILHIKKMIYKYIHMCFTGADALSRKAGTVAERERERERDGGE